MSKGDADSYGIGLQAHGEGDKAHGRLVFGHRGADGNEGFCGEITCLSVGDDGVVQVSGTTREGRKRPRHGHGRRGGTTGAARKASRATRVARKASPRRRRPPSVAVRRRPRRRQGRKRRRQGEGKPEEGKPEGDKKGGEDGMGDESPPARTSPSPS